jgi:hypothetical protein
MHTKAEILREALAFALRNVRTGRHRLGLSEAMRFQVADDTIRELRRYGGWRFLDDVVTPRPGLTSPPQPTGWETNED